MEQTKKSENQSEQSVLDLEKFKLAVENVSEQIVITDPKGIIIYVNSAVESITGYTVEESIGTKAGSLWKAPMPEEFYKELWHTIQEEKKPFIGQIKNKRKNGEEYDAAVNISPVLDDNNEVIFFVGIERDVTEEKEIDRAKTEFVSLASHQLRTPLSVINWYAEMLLNGDAGELNEKQKNYIYEIYHGNQRMISLVTSLLNVSRLEMGTFAVDPEDVDVVELAHSVVNELKIQYDNKSINMNIDIDRRIPIVQMDPKLLRMVFQNLLSNAVKYTPEKGLVSFHVCVKKRGEDLYGSSVETDSLFLKVSDNGYGITKSQKEQIFSKLFRADNVKEKDIEGTGLGLYIIHSIVENSGGKIWFESEENEGTTFYVIIPFDGMKKQESDKKLS